MGFNQDITRPGFRVGTSDPFSSLYSPEEEYESPDLSTTLGAAFRMENPLAAAWARSNVSPGSLGPVDPDYPVWEKNKGTVYEHFPNSFTTVGNDAQLEVARARIDRELKDRDILHRSGGTGFFASLVAGLLDPINLIPIGGQAVATAKIGKSVLSGARSVGFGGLVGAGASEAALQVLQETRTLEESALNVGTSVVLSGSLGGIIGLRHARRNGRLAENFDLIRAHHEEVARQDRLAAGEPEGTEPRAYPLTDTPTPRAEATAETAAWDDPLTRPGQFGTGARLEAESLIVAEEFADHRGNFHQKNTPNADVGTTESEHRALERWMNGKPSKGDSDIISKAAKKTPLLKDVTIFRGVKDERLLKNMKLEEGNVFESDQLLAHTDSLQVAEGFGSFEQYGSGILVRAHVKDGTPVVNLDGSYLKGIGNESEMLLPKGVWVAVRKVTEGVDLPDHPMGGASRGKTTLVDIEVASSRDGLAPTPRAEAPTLTPEVEQALDAVEAIEGMTVPELREAGLLPTSRSRKGDLLNAAKGIVVRQRDESISARPGEGGGGMPPGGGIDDAVGPAGNFDPNNESAIRWADNPTVNEMVDSRPGQVMGLKRGYGMNPILRLLSSSFNTGRGWVEHLTTIPFYLEKNRVDVPTARSVFERKKVRSNILLNDASLMRDDFFNKMRERTGTDALKGVNLTPGLQRAATGARDVFGKVGGRGDRGEFVPQKPLTIGEFDKRAGRAVRRGGGDEIPEVNEYAKWTADNVFDPIARELIDMGIFPEHILNLVKTGQGDIQVAPTRYLTRIYNRRKIMRDGHGDREGTLQYALTEDFMRKNPELVRAEAVRRAKEAVWHIQEMQDGRVGYTGDDTDFRPDEPDKARFEAFRTLDVDDEVIEEWLEDDLNMIVSHYVNTFVPDIEMVRLLGDVEVEDAFGKVVSRPDVSGRRIFKQLQQEFEAINDTLTGDTTIREGHIPWARKNEAERLKSEYKARRADLEQIINQVRGLNMSPLDPYSKSGRALSSIRKFNVVTKMGGVVISSLNDVARFSMRYRLGVLWESQIKGLISGPIRHIRLSIEQATELGAALEMRLAQRGKSLAMIGDDMGRHSLPERALDLAASKMFVLNGLSPWNTVMKSMVANSSSHQILRIARKIANRTATEPEITALNHLNIDSRMALRILAQFEEGKPGDIVGNVVIHNYKEWADVGAAEAYQHAIIRDTDITIVTPEPGDLPNVLNTEVGKLVGQFKTFAGASVNRTLILAGQQARLGDLHVYNGLALAVGMGMFVHILKSWQYGRDPFEHGWQNLLFNGIDRSGVGGLYMDGVHVGMRFGARPPGIHLSRWAQQDRLGVLAGPSGSVVSDLGKSLTGARALATPGERISQSQIHASRRLVPYHQLFYLSQLFDTVEGGVADALNAKNRKR